MGKENNNCLKAIDALEKYLVESCNGEIAKEYNKKADKILEKANKINDDHEKQKNKIINDYFESENGKLFYKLYESIYDNVVDAKDLIEDKTLLDVVTDEIETNVLYQEEKNKTFILENFNYDCIGNKTNEQIVKLQSEVSGLKKEKESFNKEIQQIEKEKSEIKIKKDDKDKKEKKKYLIFALLAFGAGLVSAIIGTIVYQIITFTSVITSICAVVGIVLLVLRSKIDNFNQETKTCNDKIKNNETKINELDKKIDESNDKIVKQIIKIFSKEHDALDHNLEQLAKDYDVKYDSLKKELKVIGDDAENKLNIKKDEIFSDINPVILDIFDKVLALPLECQKEFILECRAGKVESESMMLDLYKKIKKENDIENEKALKEENERKFTEDNSRLMREQNRILKQQADDARRSSEEQNRILKQQADDARRAYEEQKRQKEEAKRNGERFRTSMCYKCKNYAGCGAQWHLTGPCPNFIQK